MLSISDFKEKQILFIQSEDFSSKNKIQIENDNVSFSKDGKIVNRLSCSKILCVFIIGDLSLTTVLIRNCLKFGMSIFLLKRNFEVYASIGSAAEGNYLLREKQYNLKNEFDLAKNIVKNKISNQIILLKNHNKDKDENFEEYRKKIIEKIKNAKDEKELLGIEGSASKYFFNLYFGELGWYKRMPRVKIDHYNILLDIGYTFLFNYVDSLLRIYGFDVYKGFYHKLFFQRKSLTCDIVEPFRCIIDKQLLKSFRLKQINEKDFKYANGKYLLEYKKSQKYARIFFEAILKHKEEIFLYVKNFYRCAMKEENNFPEFKIK
jgi:CRISP-associated protein Cas1